MSDASSPYLAFVSLARFDTQLYEKSMLRRQLLREIDGHAQTMQDAHTLVKDAQKKAHDLRKSIDEKELELRIFKERERDIKRKLDTVGSVKEYTSLEHELRDVSQAQDMLENDVLSLLQEYDEANVAVQQAQERANVTAQANERAIHDKRVQGDALEKEMAALQEQRSKIVELVLPDVLHEYESMREKVPNPAVPVINSMCSACFYGITLSDMAAIRHHKMIVCKDCYRFLYENV